MVNEDEVRLYRKEAAVTLKALRRHVRWKQGKAVAHLEKRKALGHLSPEESLEDYNGLIRALVRVGSHQVYLYRFDSARYYAVRGIASGAEWLVIAARDGVVETAFPPDSVEKYLNKRGFVLIGTIQEVLA